MTRAAACLGMFLCFCFSVCLAQTPAPPQTARQALVEMFFSKTPGSFEKHLPEATRAAIYKADNGSAAAAFQSLSLALSQLHAQGQEVQTFEAGSTLLSVEDPRQHSKLEIMVENDDLRADEDEIEVSFHAYKDGQPQTAGVTPRMSFTMKQENGSWRLNEIALTVKVSLTDPQLLKAMTTRVTPTFKPGISEQSSSVGAPAWHSGGVANEAGAIASLRTLSTAEATYAQSYPSLGYTCMLSDLGGMGGAERGPHQAMLVDPRLSGGKKNGYAFTMSGCEGNPAGKYRVMAVPLDVSSGVRTLCSDQSGVVRAASADPSTCLNSGTPIQ